MPAITQNKAYIELDKAEYRWGWGGADIVTAELDYRTIFLSHEAL